MFPRCPFPQLSSVLVAASTLTLVTTPASSRADADPCDPRTSPKAHAEATIDPAGPRGIVLHARVGKVQAQPARPNASPAAPGLRTDRLSGKQLKRWQSIVQLVVAEDDRGRPLHPTLRGMWDEVAASGHEVYVELPEVRHSGSRVAGLFQIESVRPDGHTVAVVKLDLEMIDRATVGEATDRGFRRFHGLGGEERYLEVLGHELGHAVWTLADLERARQALALRSRPLELARSLLSANPDERTEILRHLSELGAQAEAQEIPARAAEALVWEELVASQEARGVQTASSSRPEAATRSSRLSNE